MTEPRSYDEILLAAAEDLQADALELIARKERDGVPADIADKHKALFAVNELFAGIRSVAIDPPDNWSPLQREVSLAIAEKLTNPHQV